MSLLWVVKKKALILTFLIYQYKVRKHLMARIGRLIINSHKRQVCMTTPLEFQHQKTKMEIPRLS